MTSALSPLTAYSHTRVLGYSVPRSTWDEFRTALGGTASTWELLWYSGGSVDIWADPNSRAWDANGGSLDPQENGGTGGLVNGISHATDPTVGTATIDRCILNISGFCTTASDPVVPGYNGGVRPNLGLTPYDTTGFTTSDPNYPNGYCNVVEYWRLYIQAAIANIRSKYPNVRMILLQPNLGGTGGSQSTCTTADSNAQPFGVVRAAYTSPYVKSAIHALTRGNVRGGFGINASSCAGFVDWAGHITTGEQSTIGAAMAAYYTSNL